MSSAIETVELMRKREVEKKENSPEAIEARELSVKTIKLSKYRNERNLMLYPFCSTSKRKRLKAIEYKSSDGSRFLQVTANHNFGMAKIWDFDILRFALSKAGEIAKDTNYFTNFVEFTIYECLKAIGRDPENGKNIIWFKEAMRRLASTTYIGNIFRDDTKIEFGFTLINYERVEDETRCGFDKIKINFDERLIESVRYKNGLLSIPNSIIREESGIKKRILELVSVSKGESNKWVVKLKRLNDMCAHEGELKKFKALLKSYELPWKIIFSSAADGSDKVTFLDK